MGTSRNLLLVESHPGVADSTGAKLAAQGHVVHRCHDGGRGFPCVGVDDPDQCPIEADVDVALVVRRGVTPSPTPLEDGVPCALRAGVPVVEEGTDMLDPYSEFVTARVGVDEEVSDALERAIDQSLRPIQDQIAQSLEPFLSANGLAADSVGIELASTRGRLRIHLIADGLPPLLAGQLSVKATDTVRGMRRSWSSIEVSMSSSPPTG